MDKPFRRGSF